MKTAQCISLIALFLFIPPGSRGAELAAARLYGLSILLAPASDEWGDFMDVSSTGASDGEGELAPSAPAPVITLPGTNGYSSLLTLDDTLYGTLYGSLSLSVPSIADASGNTVDANDNRFPDFFESALPLSAASTGYFTAGIQLTGTIAATWTRPAGVPNGVCTLVVTDWSTGSPEYYGTFSNTFEILEFTGPLSFTPGTNSVSSSASLAQVGSPTRNLFLAGMQFVKEPTNRFDQLYLQPGIRTNAPSQAYPFPNDYGLTHLYSFTNLSAFGAQTFFRDPSWPANYAGYVEFPNPTNNTAALPWGLWVLSVTDTNDANLNGIPDFSDDPSPFTIHRAQISLSRNITNLLLTIQGDIGTLYQVLQADSLTSANWQIASSVTLTNDPQPVALPLPASTNRTRFWRVRGE